MGDDLGLGAVAVAGRTVRMVDLLAWGVPRLNGLRRDVPL
jgi:hypothetical protein